MKRFVGILTVWSMGLACVLASVLIPVGLAVAAIQGDVPDADSGAVSGTVTEAGGTHRGLLNVEVGVMSATTGASKVTTTAADGGYTVTGLTAGTDYKVCFSAYAASGGASDALGYIDQCFDKLATSEAPTPVVVTTGLTASGVDAALAVGGSVSGTVTEAGGSRHGLAKVMVNVTSAGTSGGYTTTADNGSYTVTGLTSGTDYKVCFQAKDATGGAADGLGYIDQCYDRRPTSGTTTPVAVTVGATVSGVNAALAVGAAVSGSVTEARGSRKLAGVEVSVTSASTGSSGYARTAADGSYAVTGLASGTDYAVCFYAADANGGALDVQGYYDQCYNSKPTPNSTTPGTPTLVALTVGTTASGIGAALAVVPASPGPPMSAKATAGIAEALVSWTAPVNDGGLDITRYTVTASPGGHTAAATTGTTSATVGGLANGTAYTFTVTATNSHGTGPASAVSTQVTPGSPTPRYITRVYSDLFNRTPDPVGLVGWSDALAGGTPRVAVANAITYSTEYRSKLITGSYDRYLSRVPDHGGLNNWLAVMSRGSTISQIESGFIGSDEYYAKAGSTQEAWVTKLYTDVLGRPASSSEVAGWTTNLRNGMGRDQVAMGFLLSTERLTTVVNDHYKKLLGRGVDPSGLTTWVGILQRGGRDEGIIGGIIASEEYYAGA